ncbi:hypothetical protein B0T14DRAFT_189676 [Immersiella caudata]|uniref:Uncharacterized protein n=1 Tax=Immersiella caudata TaxID=314043 RepID=A0AA39WY61_9PEZI|nr:hypothetical protein B0T14DRAFT_189676 [Immersiella caudata]
MSSAEPISHFVTVLTRPSASTMLSKVLIDSPMNSSVVSPVIFSSSSPKPGSPAIKRPASCPSGWAIQRPSKARSPDGFFRRTHPCRRKKADWADANMVLGDKEEEFLGVFSGIPLITAAATAILVTILEVAERLPSRRCSHGLESVSALAVDVVPCCECVTEVDVPSACVVKQGDLSLSVDDHDQVGLSLLKAAPWSFCWIRAVPIRTPKQGLVEFWSWKSEQQTRESCHTESTGDAISGVVHIVGVREWPCPVAG